MLIKDTTHKETKQHNAPSFRVTCMTPQRIAITGSTGFVGTALKSILRAQGHDVIPVVRHTSSSTPDSISWNPAQPHIHAQDFEKIDMVVHLAGASVAKSRWTPKRKDIIMGSRRQGTRLLSQALASLKQPPRVLLSASAIGYYGARGDEILTEDSAHGQGFLANVCKIWEEETQVAQEAGIRVANMRIGLVLDPTGGLLEQMLTPFRLGAGGQLATGKQYMSWMSMKDLLCACIYIMEHESLSGPINLVAPNPVTNTEFTKTLAKILGRPSFMTVPRWALEVLFGSELTQNALIASQRVLPKRLQDAGFSYAHPTLKETLASML